MVANEKLIAEFRTCRAPFPYRDLVRMLVSLGYDEASTGGGSRRRFVHRKTGHVIRLHEPHPGNEVKPYMVRQIRDVLIELRLI